MYVRYKKAVLHNHTLLLSVASAVVTQARIRHPQDVTDFKLRINPPTSLEDFSLTVERFRIDKKSIHETGLVNYDLERRTPSTERVRP
ncbi:hypothetical protein P167DRAFT_532072 [Morchella conica CCBAS932]|uniref:Uncharacterized protein n=1 Tax=Morchella conica CCBAS932 TaxID=1392247 RepID=A0A3N4L7B2_9PEZI|nr:hypothetical protein P167DRAFT_532072 [Morchella conica CCBAS932]